MTSETRVICVFQFGFMPKDTFQNKSRLFLCSYVVRQTVAPVVGKPEVQSSVLIFLVSGELYFKNL